MNRQTADRQTAERQTTDRQQTDRQTDRQQTAHRLHTDCTQTAHRLHTDSRQHYMQNRAMQHGKIANSFTYILNDVNCSILQFCPKKLYVKATKIGHNLARPQKSSDFDQAPG